MTARLGIRISSSTSGTPAPGFEDLRVNYRWHGMEPGDPKGREDALIGRPAGPPPMSAARLQRIAEFAGHLDDGLSVEEAGKRMGVAPRTAELYEREGRHLRRPVS